MIKMASYYIKRELILSTMMVMAIALACGLFISMTLFINSFQFAVAEWIEKSTQITFHKLKFVHNEFHLHTLNFVKHEKEKNL